MSSEFEAIHAGVRSDPEEVWDRLAQLLCASARGPAKDAESLQRTDLIEDLMFHHADAFVERLDTLLKQCPALKSDVVKAHVGGVAIGVGLQRFYGMQDTLSTELEASGELRVWSRDADE